MSAWDRSWSMAQTSFGVIRRDKEMLWFPVLSGVFSLLFSSALIVPAFVVHAVDAMGAGSAAARLGVDPLRAVVLFVTYCGLTFIATFFNVCAVHTTRVRLSGGDATLLDSVKFALSRAHRILGWSLVSATVGLLLRGLDEIAERAGGPGKIVLEVLRAVLATAWSIMTIFVVPSMVYKDAGPIDAVRDSIATLKRTWGESVVRYYGLGFAMFVCMLPCLALVIGGIFLVESVAAAGFALIALGVVAGIGVFVVFELAETVFNTVLYQWATTGVAPEGIYVTQLSAVLGPRRR
jgi:hypothetical protein